MTKISKKILVVDDEQATRVSLFETLSPKGYQVSVAENGRMALDMIQKTPFDLVISDIKMPDMDGLQLFYNIRLHDSSLPVVLITGFASVDTAVEAMKKGVFDYILKPFPLEVIENTVDRALSVCSAKIHKIPPGQAEDVSSFSGSVSRKKSYSKKIIGQEDAWLRVMAKAKAVASSTATVLILGESGTGKEVLARFIHTESDRSQGPFVALNCAALPDGLLESELFGHEKGAFTGAVSSKKGKFELAEGGTLLLDEIGEIPMHLQAKLLRVLQEEEVDRLGGKQPVKFNVHVIATTNRNLKESVAQGEFRQDLYYRLNVIPLRLPSLKDRTSDIFTLADYFIDKYSKQYKRKPKKLSATSKQRFLAYMWPGNVREMENMIERSVLLSNGDFLEPWDLWDEDDEGYTPPGTDNCLNNSSSFTQDDSVTAENSLVIEDSSGQMVPLREAERQMIMQALHKTDNNRTHAAKMLGISVRTLRNKLHEYRNKGLMV